MGPTMNGLANLIPYPLGCGEQNMARIAPPVIVLQYLRTITQPQGGPIERAAIELMQEGYQRQLAYKLEDGSFSAYGPGKRVTGSMWITALTARYFRQAIEFTDIDEDVVVKAVDWLVDNQAGNGSFPERGDVLNKRIQTDPAALTAFVTLALIDNRFTLNARQRNAMNRGINFLAETWRGLEEPYPLSIVTYALHLADHPAKGQALGLLQSMATKDDAKTFWEAPMEDFERQNPWMQMPNSASIETTAYAMLSLLKAGDFEGALPTARWLLSQQNSNGGFASTSDTYAAVLALREFSVAADIPSRGSDIVVSYAYLGTPRSMRVRSDAPTILQRRRLPTETRQVQMRARGGGFAIVTVGAKHNVDVIGAWPSFVVSPQVFKPSTASQTRVSVCVNYIEGGASDGSNAAVMEVELPSGFTANADSLPGLRDLAGIRRVESEEEGTRVVFYFDKMTRAEVCPTISAWRTARVANQRPASVVVYDYYDQSRRARAFYDVLPTTVCDICDGPDCPDDGCPRRRKISTYQELFGGNVDESTDAAVPSSPFAMLLLAIPLILAALF